MNTVLLCAGSAAVAPVLYALYLALTKGIPAAKAWISGKWNAAKNDIATVKGDLASAETKFEARISALETEVSAIKAKVPA